MENLYTVQEASRPENLGKSPSWIRAAIGLGKLEAVKLGNTFAISGKEIQKAKSERLTISRAELHANKQSTEI